MSNPMLKKSRGGCKPGSVTLRSYLHAPSAIYLRPGSLRRLKSATYPPAADEQSLNAGIFGLATRQRYAGICRHTPRWALTPPFHPYRPYGRRLFSVTLLSLYKDLPVRKDGALCCPDFPLPVAILQSNQYNPRQAAAEPLRTLNRKGMQ